MKKDTIFNENQSKLKFLVCKDKDKVIDKSFVFNQSCLRREAPRGAKT